MPHGRRVGLGRTGKVIYEPSGGGVGMTQTEASTSSTYDGRGAESPQWWPSRYGPDDELGAGHELTAERTLEALKLARSGKAIKLAQLLTEDVPAFPPRSWKQI